MSPRNRLYAVALRMLAAICAMLFWMNTAHSASCGNVHDRRAGDGRGPYDYRDPSNRKRLEMVEKFHFTRSNERAALSGKNKPKRVSDFNLLSDLNFTLVWFPNHPRALLGMALFQRSLKERSPEKFVEHVIRPQNIKEAECYYKYARAFRPKDPSVYTSLGVFLYRVGDQDAALEQFQRAVELNSNSAAAQYNMGLIYFAKENYESARKHARLAYKLGYHLPHLREKLKEVGKW